MRITVNVPDRYVLVDGIRAPIEGAVPDDSVRTLQYDTASVEGLIEYVDLRFEPFRDPAKVAPWVSLWGYALTAKVEAATMEGRATDERYAAWKSVEDARAATERAAIRKAAEDLEATQAAAQG